MEHVINMKTMTYILRKPSAHPRTNIGGVGENESFYFFISSIGGREILAKDRDLNV